MKGPEGCGPTNGAPVTILRCMWHKRNTSVESGHISRAQTPHWVSRPLEGQCDWVRWPEGPVNARAGGAHAPKLLNMSPNTFRCTGDKPQSFLSRIANDAGFWSGVSRTPNGTGREGTWQGGVRAGLGTRAGLGGGP